MENQFSAGDLVWAKVHHYPWWPAIIYHEDLSSTEIQQSKREGFVLVSFFGDNSYKWLDPKDLVPFESNFSLYSNRCHSRLFVKAVNEAVDEVNHRAAIGLTCCCKFFAHYRSIPAKDFVEVDTDGYKLGGVYTVNQIARFRQEFSPDEMVSFIQKLALNSADVHQDINHSKETARALTYRKTRYAEIDEPYFEAFQVDPKKLGDPIVASDNQKTDLVQDHPSDAETQGEKKLEVKHQEIKSPAPQKGKPHATKSKQSEKTSKHQASNTKSSEDHISKKKKRSKSEVEKKLDFSSSTVFVKEQPAVSCSKHTDVNLGHNLRQEETPVNSILHHYQEIYVKYQEGEADRTHVQVGRGGMDISEKMLCLLNECNRIVRALM